MNNDNRVLIVLLFAITFMLIGWTSPIMYATYAPESSIIESHKFTAQNASVNSDTHAVCFERTVHQSAIGETFAELYLIGENDADKKIDVSFESSDRYYRHGYSIVKTDVNLPENLKPGRYQYVLVISMELADGRVARPITFRSEPFHIKAESDNIPDENKLNC